MPLFIAHFRTAQPLAQLNPRIQFKDHKSVVVDDVEFTFDQLWLPPLSLGQRYMSTECMLDICEVLRPLPRAIGRAQLPRDAHLPPTVLYYGDPTKPTADLVTTMFSGLNGRIGNPGIRISIFGSYAGTPSSITPFVNDLGVSSWFEAARVVHDCLRAHLQAYEARTAARAGSILSIHITVGTRSLVLLDVDHVPLVFQDGIFGAAVTAEETMAGLKARIALPSDLAKEHRFLHVILDCPTARARHDAMKDALHFGFQLQRALDLPEDSEEDD